MPQQVLIKIPLKRKKWKQILIIKFLEILLTKVYKKKVEKSAICEFTKLDEKCII